MVQPRAIKLEAAESVQDYGRPQRFVVVGGIPVTEDEFVAALTGIAGYDDGETQTLKHVEGVLGWVTDAPE